MERNGAERDGAERDDTELFRNSTAFQEFTMTGNHHHPAPPDAAFLAAAANHYLQSDTGNQQHPAPPDAAFLSATTNHYLQSDTGNHYHPAPPNAAFLGAAANHYLQSDTGNNHQQPNSNSTFWAVGNQLPATGFVPAAAINHHQHNTDFLAAAAAGNQLNGTAVRVSPRYADALLESDFARLNLMPAVRPPAFVAPTPNYNGGSRNFAGRNYSIFNDSNGNGGVSFPQSGDIDMRELRIQSAARGLYINSDFDELCMNGGGGRLNGVSAYDMAYNSGRNNMNLNDYHYNHHPQSFRNSSYDLGPERSWNNRRVDGMEAMWRPRQRARLTSLKDLRGKILSVARDQHGCRFLQSKFEEGKPEEIEMIFMEVKDHICELMVDQFGNYLVQKFLAACNQEQMTQLLMSVTSDEHRFIDICVNTHGSRSMQRLLEFLTTAEQRARFISVLRRTTLPLTKDGDGHHVIQYCLKLFSFQDKKHILNVVADHCMEIATDKNGCCVLQQCVEHAVGDPRDRLISEISSNAIILSEHIYGNYVVQYILGLRIAQATADILAQLCGNFVSLSMNKYGSNVVEKFFKEPGIVQESQVVAIIEEIIYSPHFLRVLQDPFGNYVSQTAFAASKGSLRSAMISLIQANNPNLHSHPHGKRVLQCIRGNKFRL